MNSIRLPLDTKSLYFNIKNDNLSGHTATVATPLTKKEGDDKVEDVLKLCDKEVDISSKPELVSLLIKHSKSKVLIKKLYVFDKISVNGKFINNDASFGMYVKEEVDEAKKQFGRLKLHYPPKLIYEDEELNINNKEIYKCVSRSLYNYAFLIRAIEYDPETDILNFDALIVGQNEIPYSKVFINEKGTGNKFNLIFNETADDYDQEIILLRKKYGTEVNPFNYMEYLKKMKEEALEIIKDALKTDLEIISFVFPYSLFDFMYIKNGVRKYGILRVTATKNKYFNISMMQKLFLSDMSEDASVFLVSDINDSPKLSIYDLSDLSHMSISVNSVKYEEGDL